MERLSDARLPLLSLENRVVKSDDSHNQPSHDNSLGGGGGLKDTLHGTIYQVKLLMFYLQVAFDKDYYRFELYSEKTDAEKFDDLVFKYGINGPYRFLQAKHTLSPEQREITIRQLLSDDLTKPFSLQKYFISFRKIKQKPQYKENIKDLIICTNADFRDEIKKIYRGLIQEINYDDAMLNNDGGKSYKLILNEKDDLGDDKAKVKKLKRSFIKKLKDASDLNRLAKELDKVVFEKKSLNLTNELFKDYHVPLVKEVFDKHTSEEGNKKKCYCMFKENFITVRHLSNEAELLRNAFEAKATERAKINSLNLGLILSGKKLAVPPTFGEPTKSTEKTSTCVSNKGIKLPNDSVMDCEIENFCKKFVFAVKQPDEEALGKHIKKEICNNLDCLKDFGLASESMAELIHDLVQKQMLDWLKSPISLPLTDKDNFFKVGAEKLVVNMHLIPDHLYGSCIKETGVIIDDTSKNFKEFKTFIDFECNESIIIISSKKSTILSQAKFYQVKKQCAWPLECVLRLNKYSDVKEKFLFKDNLLVILCENESQYKPEDIRRLYNELADSINNHDKKIVLITLGDSILANFFIKDDNFKNNYKQMLDETSVGDLDRNYLQKKLLKKNIIFQSKKTTLAYLLGFKSMKLNRDEKIKELEKVLKQEALIELISDKNVKVGNELSDFSNSSSPNDDLYIDITRQFNHQILSKNKLRECMELYEKDLFAICSVTREYLYNVIPPKERGKVREFRNGIQDETFFKGRFFILCDPQNNIKVLFKKCNEENVHWLSNISNDKFVLKYSNNLFKLRDFIVTEDSGKTAEDFRDSSAIIAGDPGIGKSTVLTTFSKILGLPSWFIKIDLNSHEVNMENANFDNLEGIMNFLFKISLDDFESALAKILLEYRLEHQGQIVLLLDGYDEIKDQNQKKVIQLLKTLKHTNGKAWLTTRIHKQCEVENALGIFSYRLNPFDEHQQHDFLKKFWIKKLNKSDKEDCIDEFTEKLLEHFRELGFMKEGDLVGIVLQAKMVADIFKDECKKYLQTRNFEPSKFGIRNIFELYEKFIKYQYEIYFAEKRRIGKSLLSKGSQIILTKSYTKAHGRLAMKALFSDDETCKKLLRHQPYQTFLKNDLSGMGLIKNFRSFDVVDFVHHTYAEYFAAKLLVNMFSKSKDHPKYKLVREFLLRNIFFDRNKLIHKFFKHEIKKFFDLNSKWNKIQQDCDLLKKTETEGVLQLRNISPTEDSNVRMEVQQNGSVSLENDNIYAIRHYPMQIELQNIPDTQFQLKVIEYMRKSKNKELNFILQIIDFMNHSNEEQKRQCIEDLVTIFISMNNKNGIQRLIELNDYWYYVYICYPDIINYVNSIDSFQKKLTEKIIIFLENVKYHYTNEISAILKNTNFKSLQSFYIGITQHSNVIDYTKSCINQTFKGKEFGWLERQGVLISSFLKILTPEMAVTFNSCLQSCRKSCVGIYASSIFDNMISCIVDMIETEDLPQINKLAFLNMIVRFTDNEKSSSKTNAGQSPWFPFDSKQLKSILKLINNMLNEQHEHEILESVEFLYILRVAGLKLIKIADQKLLVLDPASGFQYELSSTYMNRIIKQIQRKNQFRDEDIEMSL